MMFPYFNGDFFTPVSDSINDLLNRNPFSELGHYTTINNASNTMRLLCQSMHNFVRQTAEAFMSDFDIISPSVNINTQ